MDIVTKQQYATPGDVVLITERSRWQDKVEYRTFAAEALRPLLPDPQFPSRALAARGVYAAGADNYAPGSCGLPGTFGEWGVVGVEVIGESRPWGKVQTTAQFVAADHAHRLGREVRDD